MRLGSKVLVATDLSEAANEAIVQGHARAGAAGGELVVCHVVPGRLHHDPLFPQRTAETERLLEIEQNAARAVEMRVVALTGRKVGEFRLIVESGSPEAAIVRAADEHKATLVVVSSQGTTGLDRLLLGSVASRVVRYAHCPVLVARRHEKTGKILAATDFSDPALPAVAAAVEEARASGARLTLLHSIDAFPNPAIGWGVPFGASWVVSPQRARRRGPQERRVRPPGHARALRLRGRHPRPHRRRRHRHPRRRPQPPGRPHRPRHPGAHRADAHGAGQRRRAGYRGGPVLGAGGAAGLSGRLITMGLRPQTPGSGLSGLSGGRGAAIGSRRCASPSAPAPRRPAGRPPHVDEGRRRGAGVPRALGAPRTRGRRSRGALG